MQRKKFRSQNQAVKRAKKKKEGKKNVELKDLVCFGNPSFALSLIGFRRRRRRALRGQLRQGGRPRSQRSRRVLRSLVPSDFIFTFYIFLENAKNMEMKMSFSFFFPPSIRKNKIKGFHFQKTVTKLSVGTSICYCFLIVFIGN